MLEWLQRLTLWPMHRHLLQLLRLAVLLLQSAAQRVMGWTQLLLLDWGCKGRQAADDQAPVALLYGCCGMREQQLLGLPPVGLLLLLLVCQTGRTGLWLLLCCDAAASASMQMMRAGSLRSQQHRVFRQQAQVSATPRQINTAAP